MTRAIDHARVDDPLSLPGSRALSVVRNAYACRAHTLTLTVTLVLHMRAGRIPRRHNGRHGRRAAVRL